MSGSISRPKLVAAIHTPKHSTAGKASSQKVTRSRLRLSGSSFLRSSTRHCDKHVVALSGRRLSTGMSGAAWLEELLDAILRGGLIYVGERSASPVDVCAREAAIPGRADVMVCPLLDVKSRRYNLP